MNIHCIGIGGIGLSSVAQWCLHRGDRVTGSDQEPNAITEMVAQKGAEIYFPQKKEKVPLDTDLVIYSQAIDPQNPERQIARERDLPQKSYFEFLGEISKDFKTIAVAGTHGKTTTCGMIASGMITADFPATFFIGSTLRELENRNFKAGTNPWAVIEACEYRNNFQFLSPQILLLTNIEWDHPDYYKTEKEYFEAFQKLIHRSQKIIYHADDATTKDLVKDFKGELLPVLRSEKINLGVPGQHNQKNAQLAQKLFKYLNLSSSKTQKGLLAYTGAGRRMEYHGEKNGFSIYDDYGHHPTEIRATLQALREKHPGAHIALIYEPHQFSRTRHFFDDFVFSLGQADILGLYPIYATRDTAEDQRSVSLEKLQEKLPASIQVEKIPDIKKITSQMHKGDVLVFMGAGKINLFARDFLTQA